MLLPEPCAVLVGELRRRVLDLEQNPDPVNGFLGKRGIGGLGFDEAAPRMESAPYLRRTARQEQPVVAAVGVGLDIAGELRKHPRRTIPLAALGELVLVPALLIRIRPHPSLPGASRG